MCSPAVMRVLKTSQNVTSAVQQAIASVMPSYMQQAFSADSAIKRICAWTHFVQNRCCYVAWKPQRKFLLDRF